MWQFLIALLEDPSNCAAITWTGRGMEFKLIEPEEVSTNHSYIEQSLMSDFCELDLPLMYQILKMSHVSCSKEFYQFGSDINHIYLEITVILQ